MCPILIDQKDENWIYEFTSERYIGGDWNKLPKREPEE
jgi:hypothetical protein